MQQDSQTASLPVCKPKTDALLKTYFQKIDVAPWFVICSQTMKLAGFSRTFASLFDKIITLETRLGSILTSESISSLSQVEATTTLAKEIRLELQRADNNFSLDFNFSCTDHFLILRADFSQYCVIKKKELISQFDDNRSKLEQIRLTLSRSEYHVIWEIDDLGVVLSATEIGLMSNLGFKPDDVIGRDFTGFILVSDIPIVQDQLAELRDSDGQSVYLNYAHLNSEGKRIATQASLQKSSDLNGKVNWIIVDTFQSPTLQNMLENMTHKVVASIAHDIKQPCNVITNSISIVESNLKKMKELRSPAEDLNLTTERNSLKFESEFPDVYLKMRKILNLVNRETLLFSSLVDDFLVYENCRVKANFIKESSHEEFDLVLALQNLVVGEQNKEDLVDLRMELGDQSVYCLGPKSLLVDRGIGVLLQSAVAYVVNSTVDPVVTLRLTVVNLDNGYGLFEVEVLDNGPLLEDHSGFIDFSTGIGSEPSEIAKRRRVGVGYHLCEKLARAFNGRFEIYADVNQGTSTKFSFQLEYLSQAPNQRLAEVPDKQKSPLKISTSKKRVRILFADDVYTQRRIMEMMFKMEKIEYEIVSDGVEVIEKIIDQKKEFDVVLIDCHMQEIDGPEAVRQLRKSGYTGLIVGMTGSSSVADEENFRKSGVDYIKHKPLDIRLLLKKLAPKIETEVQL